MAWIRMIPEAEADGPLAELYRSRMTPHGVVDNILKVHSLIPEALRSHYALYRTLLFGPSGLSRAEREMIGVLVSATSRCHY